MSTTLYRFYTEDKQLLYVGISNNAMSRFSSHEKYAKWWKQAHQFTLEHFNTREEAAQAEVSAILMEKPIYNVMHNNQEQESTWSWWETPDWTQRVFDFLYAQGNMSDAAEVFKAHHECRQPDVGITSNMFNAVAACQKAPWTPDINDKHQDPRNLEDIRYWPVLAYVAHHPRTRENLDGFTTALRLWFYDEKVPMYSSGKAWKEEMTCIIGKTISRKVHNRNGEYDNYAWQRKAHWETDKEWVLTKTERHEILGGDYWTWDWEE